MNSNMSKPVVDTHFHVFNAGDGLPGARYKPAYRASLSDWQGLALAAGVGRGVLVQTSFMGTDNSRLLHELAAEPERLRGVAVVAPDVEPALLRQWHVGGVRGIRINLAGVSHQVPQWRQADRLWSVMVELGWHLELHTDVGALSDVLRQLPGDLPLVIDHMGKPDRAAADDPTFQCVLKRLRRSSVHVKLSGPYRLGGRPAHDVARLWLSLLGEDRLVWGSDWPWTNHEAEVNYAGLLNALRHWVGDAVAEKALRDNPLALYWGL